MSIVLWSQGESKLSWTKHITFCLLGVIFNSSLQLFNFCYYRSHAAKSFQKYRNSTGLVLVEHLSITTYSVCSVLLFQQAGGRICCTVSRLYCQNYLSYYKYSYRGQQQLKPGLGGCRKFRLQPGLKNFEIVACDLINLFGRIANLQSITSMTLKVL